MNDSRVALLLAPVLALATLLSACGQPVEDYPFPCTSTVQGICLNGADAADLERFTEILASVEPGALDGLRFSFGPASSCVWVAEGHTYWGSRHNLVRGIQLLRPGTLAGVDGPECR